MRLRRDLLAVATQQAGHRRFHRGERGAEIVGDGIQQRGLQPFALPLGLRLAELFDGTRAFDGDGHQTAYGIERLARKRCS